MAKLGPGSPTERLIDSLRKRCESVISNLETSAQGIAPKDCLKLFSYMGVLEYYLVQPAQGPGMTASDVVGPLRGRLQMLKAAQGPKLLVCLAAGTEEILTQLDRELLIEKDYYLRGRLGSSLVSLEANDYGLLGLRDRLGYAEHFIRSMKIAFTPSVQKQIEAVDERLREFLPQAIRQFRENGDDPTPIPTNFPQSFWWRHIN